MEGDSTVVISTICDVNSSMAPLEVVLGMKLLGLADSITASCVEPEIGFG